MPDEILSISTALEDAVESAITPDISRDLQNLRDAVKDLDVSFCGSWLGYHSRVYYNNFQPTPAGANFSQEWGLKDMSFTSLGSRGDWIEYSKTEIEAKIAELAGVYETTKLTNASERLFGIFAKSKDELFSILNETRKDDDIIEKYLERLDTFKIISHQEILNRWLGGGQIITRDMIALGQGSQAPIHKSIEAEIVLLDYSRDLCSKTAEICKKIITHLQRKDAPIKTVSPIGERVFIGHGRSLVWRELKDFVNDRLQLPWDEFNRTPIAGVPTTARLIEMLDSASIAFIIMTAEDETADGKLQARMNVIHEVGLFQGRLGFTRAIVLLEDGCEEFSNIYGLGQIRFPKGRISTSFEEVRLVLEREGILSPPPSEGQVNSLLG